MNMETMSLVKSAREGEWPGRCRDCEVRGTSICSSLSLAGLDDLSRIGRIVHVQPGQTLLWEGDEADLVGNVLDGILKISNMTGDGREQIVGLLFPSDFLGRPFGDMQQQSVTALTAATVCVFRRGAFDTFSGTHDGVERALLDRTLQELDRARRWMLLLGRMSAVERVASLVIELIERVGAPDGGAVILPLSRQQMADLLGLTIETVSRSMTKFERAGLIELPGGRRIALRDEQALRRIAAG
jgi:CRP/FNR family transcriptional regulator